ncbi:unnamed protein product [Mesocestoides corti]|uniref:Uncharacterized protein n=1 Tax=Mesocestoides corti TaxID=53468 RepID=A0A0R3UFS6_MESCO|nr:unnamed protein product [Mesocestoides corti]
MRPRPPATPPGRPRVTSSDGASWACVGGARDLMHGRLYCASRLVRQLGPHDVWPQLDFESMVGTLK